MRLPLEQPAPEKFFKIGKLERKLRLTEMKAARGAVDAAVIGDLQEPLDRDDLDGNTSGPGLIDPAGARGRRIGRARRSRP